MSGEPCRPLAWDTEWWGLPTAVVTDPPTDETGLGAIDGWCRANQIELLYFLCPSDRTAAAHLAESSGFRIMDVRVTLEHQLAEDPPGAPSRPEGVTIRLADAGDAAPLGALASTSFRGTRFYADPRLPDIRCDELYRVWMEQECRSSSDSVLVAEVDGEPAAYVSYSVDPDDGRGAISLVGVAAPHRGTGLGSVLLAEALRSIRGTGASAATVVTQGRNVPALRLYERQGFHVRESGLWFHKWYPAHGDP